MNTPGNTFEGSGSTDGMEQAEKNFWSMLGILLSRWKTIAGVTFVAAVGSVLISLALPDWYQASTRLLPPPQTSSSGITNLFNNNTSSGLQSLASSFLGQTSGTYSRYLTILTSEKLLREVVDEFDLEEVYQTTDSPAPTQFAVRTLRENTTFEIDKEYQYLSVKVYDRDPQRAADIANYFAERLNSRNAHLTTEHAANYRKYVEQRYRHAEAALDSARRAKQRFEEQHGVVELPEQAKQFLSTFARLRSLVIQREIEMEALQEELGSQNPQVQSLRTALQAAKNQQQQLLGGDSALLPVPYQNLPSLTREYAQIMQKIRIQEEIVKFVRPLYEQALFNEQRQSQAVQIVDPATPPVEDAWPPRPIICIMTTLSAFVLAILAVLARAWLKRNSTYLSRQLQSNLGNSPSEQVSA